MGFFGFLGTFDGSKIGGGGGGGGGGINDGSGFIDEFEGAVPSLGGGGTGPPPPSTTTTGVESVLLSELSSKCLFIAANIFFILSDSITLTGSEGGLLSAGLSLSCIFLSKVSLNDENTLLFLLELFGSVL